MSRTAAPDQAAHSNAAPDRAALPEQAGADDSARLFVAIGRLSRALRRDSPFGLGHSATATLATVVTSGPIRTGDLAAREGVSAPTMTRIVSALVVAGYARREPDPEDGRACLVTATAEGERATRQVRSARSQALMERVRRLPADQRAALAAALPALEALAEDN